MNAVLHPLAAAVVGLPLTAAILLSIPRCRPALCRLVPWTALPAIAAVALWPDGGAAVFRWVFLEARFGLDATGRLFLFFTAALWLLAGVFAGSYLKGDRHRARFFFFYALAMSGNLGLILSGDMVGFYVFFALMSFSSYGLVVHTGDPDAVRAGRVYLALVVIGEILLFAGMAALAASSGSLDLPVLTGAAHTAATWVLVLAGFGIKAGALPLHVWLPLAHPAAPTPASAVLSGAMIKAGLLGWLRFIPVESAADPSWGAVCIAAGFTAALYGVAVGALQSHPKTILAYSSISQMGLITVGFGLALCAPSSTAGALSAVALYAVHHGFAKGALFLGVGILSATAAGSRASRIAWAGFLLAAFSLAGAPITSGAIAKTALKESVVLVPPAWRTLLGILLPLASAATTVLMARLAYVMTDRLPAHGRPASGMWLPWVAMLLLVAAPLFVLPAAEGARRLSLDAVGPSLWPLAAGGAPAALAWAAARRRRAPSLPLLPAGDIVVIYSAAVRFLVRIGEKAGAALPAGAPGGEVFARLYQKTVGAMLRLETSGAGWQTSGLFFLLLAGVFFLYFLFAA